MSYESPITGAERAKKAQIIGTLGEYASSAYVLQTELSLNTHVWARLAGHVEAFHGQYGERIRIDTEQRWHDLLSIMVERQQEELQHISS